MKNINFFLILIIFLLFFSKVEIVNSQNSFEWDEPVYEGSAEVEWSIFFEDSLGSMEDKWPYKSDNIWAYSQDMIQHSDGDMLILNRTGFRTEGYTLTKVDTKTGSVKWTSIIRPESIGFRLVGLNIFELPTGNIEILGSNFEASSDIILAQFGYVFGAIHDKVSGEVVEKHVPMGLAEGAFCIDLGVRITPSLNRDFYMVGEGISNGFWLRRLLPQFEKSKVDTLLVVDEIFRNGVKIEGYGSQVTDVLRLPDGNFLLKYYMHSGWLSDISSEIANLLIWVSDEGEVLRMLDVSQELNFATHFEIIHTEMGILAFTNNSLTEERGSKFRSTAVLIDHQGNIQWIKEIPEDRDEDYIIDIASLNNDLGFAIALKEVGYPSITLYTLSYSGEMKEIGDYASKISYHTLQPFDMFATAKNDLIIWQDVRLDSVIQGVDLNDTYSRSYAIKINGDKLGLSTSSNEEEYNRIGLQVFPNPTDQILNIDLKGISNKNKTVKLINHLGQVVLVKENVSNETQFSIDVSSLNSGLYNLEVREKDVLIGLQKVSILK